MQHATGNSANNFYVSSNIWAAASANDGGGSGTERGSLFAINPQSLLNSGATNWVENSVQENNVAITTGASAKLMYGMKVIITSNNAVAASTDSGGYVVGIQAGGTNTLACGYCFGQNGGDHGIASTGSLIGAAKTGTSAVNYGLDFGHMTFNNAAIRGPDTQDLDIQVGTGGGARLFVVNSGGNGAGFVIHGAAATITERLDVTPGTGSTGQAIISTVGTSTGGLAFQAGANPLVLGNSSGIIEIGTTGAFAANSNVATAMSSVGPVGSHTTIQKWLTITESDGSTVGWIPVF
jgi:hypothetical protein